MRRPVTRESRSVQALLTDEGRAVVGVYDGHYFWHANTDMARLRGVTRSLLSRALSYTSRHPSGGPARTLRRRLLAARSPSDDLSIEEYAARCIIHVAEFIAAKTDGLLYETTDRFECARRCGMNADEKQRHGRDICAMECALLDAVGWDVYGGLDGLTPAERAVRPRLLVAETSDEVRRINASFVRVQSQREGEALLLERAEREADLERPDANPSAKESALGPSSSASASAAAEAATASDGGEAAGGGEPAAAAAVEPL